MARGAIVRRCLVCRKNISKCEHKKAVYSIVYRIGNKQKWEAVGTRKEDAEKKLTQVMSTIDNGTYSKPVKINFKDFAKKWLEDYAKISVKPTTFDTYERTIRFHLIPFFGDIPLLNITPEKIQSFIAKTINKRSPKTVNNLIILLRTILKYAKRWKYIRENPALDIDNVRLEHKEEDFLNPDEIRQLLKQASEPLKTMLLTAVLTGMRQGELLALQWGDIDWNSNTIFVRRSICWIQKDSESWQFVSPKSKSSRRAIVMSPKLREALQTHHLVSPVNQYDLVFCNANGKPIDRRNLVNRQFNPTLALASLRRVSWHSLRHSYTALLIAQGENIKFIQSQLGHASIQTTLDRYGHLLPVSQVGVGDRVDKQLFGSYDNNALTEICPKGVF